MTPVRPAFIPAPPLAAQTSAPISAQRAFFAALNSAAAAAPVQPPRIDPAEARRPVAATAAPPRELETASSAERAMRPGARLDIRV